jgi:FixJ family two-component response regulator
MAKDTAVFLVDDDEAVRSALSRLLKSVGYEVRTYPSADALLAEPSIPVMMPIVIVTDLKMPGIDGLALSERLAAADVPFGVVFLSGYGDIPTTVRAIKDGAVDFLEKPVREEQLFEAVERAAERSRERLRAVADLSELRTRYARLTPRERQVCALVVSGMINKEVAWELGTSEKTIKVHRARVVEKFEARSLPDLVRMTARLGIGATPAPIARVEPQTARHPGAQGRAPSSSLRTKARAGA